MPAKGFQPQVPPLPERDPSGHRPAIATARVILARQIIRARRAAGLSRRQLAERAGLSPETLARLESGKHTPKPSTIQKLERALDGL